MNLSDYFGEYVVRNKLVVAVVVLLGLLFLWQLKSILLALFVAFIIAAASLPLVERLVKRGVPRSMASLAPILMTLLLIILLLLPIVLAVANQTGGLTQTLSGIIFNIEQMIPNEWMPDSIQESLLNRLSDVGSQLYQVTGGVVEVTILLFLILFVSYFLLLENDSIKREFLNQFPKSRRSQVERVIERVELKLGGWLRGQLMLSFMVGFASYMAYRIIGLPFALSLAFLAGVLEIIPSLGPLLAIIPALLLALTISPLTFVYTLIAYVIIQAAESYLLVPKIMQHAVGMHPVMVVVAVVAGSSLFGVMGALLAVPLVATVMAVVSSWNAGVKANHK
jgi:predicted PurR-regulated permease PerM